MKNIIAWGVFVIVLVSAWGVCAQEKTATTGKTNSVMATPVMAVPADKIVHGKTGDNNKTGSVVKSEPKNIVPSAVPAEMKSGDATELSSATNEAKKDAVKVEKEKASPAAPQGVEQKKAESAPSFTKGKKTGPFYHTSAPAAHDVTSASDAKLYFENKYYKAQLTIHGGVFSSFSFKHPSFKENVIPRKSLKKGLRERELNPIDMIKTWHSSFLPFVFSNIQIEKHAEALENHTFYHVTNVARNLYLEQKWEVESRKESGDKTIITLKLHTDKPCLPSSGSEENCFPVEIRKVYTFNRDSYEIGLDVYFKNITNSKVSVKKIEIQVPSLHEDEAERGFFNPVSVQKEAICLDSDGIQVQSYQAILSGPKSGCGGCSGCTDGCSCNRTNSKQSVFAKGARWAGIDARYFLMAVVKNYTADDGGCAFRAVPIKEMPGYGLIITTMSMKGKKVLEPGQVERLPLKIFIGPKDLNHLNRVKIFEKVPEAGSKEEPSADPKLSESVDFGIFWFIGKPMIWLLKIVYGFLGNWGLAIIFLTILIKLATLYWTNKSMRSMKKMASLKPEMDELNKKYAGDKAKLNEEIMALYKKHGVNPLGGCLPMFLQMPIYIAWYYALMASVELYRAPLFGWIDDLTGKDPYFVLPVLMGILMFIQQKITPTSGDNQQAKMMMYFMPVMFTGIMLFLPSGLTLYILTNTILGLAHQWYMNQTDDNA